MKGHLPLPLHCRYPGKWFTVKSVSKLTNGNWKVVDAAKTVAQSRCKKSRTVQTGAGSKCVISGILPEISAADGIKMEFYCWEIGEKNHLFCMT